MASFREVMGKYGDNPLHFIAPLLFAFFLSIAAFFTALGIYLFISMILSYVNAPLNAYYYVLGLTMALFVLSLAGFKGGIIEGFHTALRGRRIKLVEFIKVAKRTAWPILMAIIVRLLLWILSLLPLAYVLYYGLDILYIALAALYSTILLATFEYLLLPQFTLITVHETPLIKSFGKSIRMGVRYWRSFLPVFFALAVNFILKYIPLLNLISFFFLYPVAYSVLVGRVANYAKTV